MSDEQRIYYDTLHRCKQKGMNDHDARKAAYLASQAGKTKTPRRRKKK